uniref:RNase_PH_C domain-containing protein n=1 Tax=Steinernema glaseri TaxID=37863 RepID=A0A1I8A972_9BILA
MKGLPAAVTVGLSDVHPCVDLSGREESASSPCVTVAMMGKEDIVLIHLQNTVYSERVATMLDCASTACEKINGLMETALMQHLQTSFNRAERRFAAPSVV